MVNSLVFQSNQFLFNLKKFDVQFNSSISYGNDLNKIYLRTVGLPIKSAPYGFFFLHLKWKLFSEVTPPYLVNISFYI